MKRIISLLLVTVLAVSLAACGGKAESSGSIEGEEPVKDTLIYAPIFDATTMDPHVQNDHSELCVAMVYSTLLTFDTQTNKIIGDLANEWSVSDDGLTWTFKLKEGVRFHNGKELTAEDVKGTYDRFINPDADSSYLVVKEICKMFVQVDVIDKYTVSITTDEPYGPMTALLSNRSLAIMDKDIIAEYGDQTGLFVESTVGTGPYMVTEWRKGEEMVMTRNDDYFGDLAKIKTLIWRPIADGAARVIALQNGEVDLIIKLTPEDVRILDEDPNIDVVSANSVGQQMFRFGCNDSIISNTKVRQAITYAIDREAILNGLMKGAGEVSTSSLASVTWGYNNLGVIKQDQEKAKKLSVGGQLMGKWFDEENLLRVAHAFEIG